MTLREGRDGVGGVKRDQWRMGEASVDGWGGGPLSESENAARLCGARHGAAVGDEREGSEVG